jgi:hypothetical protein
LKKLGDDAVDDYKKKNKADSNEAKDLRTQINQLNDLLRVEKEGRTSDKSAHESALNNFKIDNFISGKLGALKTVFDTLPIDVKNTTVRALLNKELQDNNAHFVLDENGNPTLKKRDGTNYYNEQQQLVTMDKFIESALVKSKSLINSAPTPQPANQPQNNGSGNPALPNNGGANNVIPGLSDLINEASQSLTNNNPVSLIGGGQ